MTTPSSPPESAKAWEAQAARFGMLQEVVLLINKATELEPLLKNATKRVKWVLDFERCTLSLLRDDGQTYSIRTLLETRRHITPVFEDAVDLNVGISGEVIRTASMKFVVNLQRDHAELEPLADPHLVESGIISVLAVPMEVLGKAIGAMTFSTARDDGFSREDMKVAITFASHLGLAIDRFQQNTRLVEANKRLAFLASYPELNPGIIFEVDLEGRAQYLNPAAKERFPLIEEQGFSHGLLSDVPDLLDVIRAQDHMALIDEKQVNERWYQRTMHLVNDDKFLRVYCIDITEHKHAEVLEKAKIAAEEASRAKSMFFANMSHELRTPLNAILGFTQVMERDADLPAQYREYLGIIDRSGEHLLGLINSVLEMSKIEAGKSELSVGAFDFHRMIQSISEMMYSHAVGKGLQLLIEMAMDVPQFVITDESKLRQVIINLVNNGIKFTDEGGVTLRVGYIPDKSRLLFEVEDSGQGIAADELTYLFEPFIQTETGIESKEGTGLGLPISRNFVNMMGGEITVKSRVNEGTLFTFFVEVDLATKEDIPETYSLRRVTGLAEPENDYRILVVDDKEDNRRLMREWLGSVGFNVREAVHGKEGLEIWEEWGPQLVWMDMRMPVMDGYEATKRIKATTKGQATVVIEHTASDYEHERNIVQSDGCHDIVSKPVRESVIFDKINEFLGVEYIYETIGGEAGAEDTAVVDFDEDSKIDISGLSPELVAAFDEASMAGDMDALRGLIEQVADKRLSAQLTRMVDAYRIDLLMELFG